MSYTTNLNLTAERSNEIRSDSGVESIANPWEGRLFGALVLAAFLLYGIGSGMADETIGLVLVTLNSIAVTTVGVAGFRLLRSESRPVGLGYLVSRIAEAVLLAGGIAIMRTSGASGDDSLLAANSLVAANADNVGYLLAMLALAIGSVPFCLALGRERWLPKWMALWGAIGYLALGIGSALELATGRSLAILFAMPGGLFELVLGLFLVWRGFRRVDPAGVA